MQVGYLVDHDEFIPTVARWHHDEWAYLRPGDSVEVRITRLRECCGNRAIPTVVIAFAGSTLLGSAMLIPHYMDTRMELSPWLAGVFVAPDHRGRGSVLRWCGGFTSTRRAHSTFTHVSVGRQRSVRGTEPWMLQ